MEWTRPTAVEDARQQLNRCVLVPMFCCTCTTGPTVESVSDVHVDMVTRDQAGVGLVELDTLATHGEDETDCCGGWLWRCKVQGTDKLAEVDSGVEDKVGMWHCLCMFCRWFSDLHCVVIAESPSLSQFVQCLMSFR